MGHEDKGLKWGNKWFWYCGKKAATWLLTCVPEDCARERLLLGTLIVLPASLLLAVHRREKHPRHNQQSRRTY